MSLLQPFYYDYYKFVELKVGIDLAEANGDDSWTLAIPARFIIGKSGVVEYARVDPDYTHRPEPQETLDALIRLIK